MIQKIKTHSALGKFVEDTCCENDICVSFDDNLLPTSYAIVKVDKYYNSLNLAKTPASIDCLIIRECINGGFGLTLVELKSIETGQGFTLENMKEKFETVLYDFIKTKFNATFDIEYKEVRLYFVSRQEIYKRDLGLKMDMLINLRFPFNGKKLMITPHMPTPTIKNCYS